MALPPCFKPSEECVAILERVRDGYEVRHEQAMPLVRGRLLKIFSGPTSRSGYELTADGEEALSRAALPRGLASPDGRSHSEKMNARIT